MAEPSKASPPNFITQMLPLYHGPTIKIRINADNTEITISRNLLCRASPVFTKMFYNGHFKESQEQVLDLEDMDGVISSRALDAFIQWLYRGTINFDIKSTEEKIPAAMELVRFADMYNVDELEAKMARYIKEILASAKPPYENYGLNQNTYFLKSDHIISALNLPRGHAVRRLLAAASVEGYLKGGKYKFADLAQDYTSYGADLLQECSWHCAGCSEKMYVWRTPSTERNSAYLQNK